MELPASYLSKFGHLHIKEGSSAVCKALETPCPLRQYELNDDTESYSKSSKRSTCLSPVMSLISSASTFKRSFLVSSDSAGQVYKWQVDSHFCLTSIRYWHIFASCGNRLIHSQFPFLMERQGFGFLSGAQRRIIFLYNSLSHVVMNCSSWFFCKIL